MGKVRDWKAGPFFWGQVFRVFRVGHLMVALMRGQRLSECKTAKFWLKESKGMWLLLGMKARLWWEGVMPDTGERYMVFMWGSCL